MHHSDYLLGLDISVLIILVFSLGSSLRKSLHSRQPRPNADQVKVYEDEDGKASEESQKAFSVRIQNIFLVAVSTAAFTVNLTELVLGLIHKWAFVTSLGNELAIWVSNHDHRDIQCYQTINFGDRPLYLFRDYSL